MPPSRRHVLRISALGTGIALAGCTSGSNIVYPSAEDDTADNATAEQSTAIDGQDGDSDVSADSADPDAQSDDRAQPTQSGEHERLASETDRIFEELRWFQREYDAVVDSYRRTIQEAIDRITVARERIGPDESYEANFDEAEQTEQVVEEILTGITDQFEPQYTDHRQFVQANGAYFRSIKLFIDRRDYVRVDRILRRFESYLRSSMLSDSIEERYPADPIANRLYGWMMPNRDPGDRLFAIGYDPDDFQTFVANDGGMHILADPSGAVAETDIESLYEPFDAPRYRRRNIYLRVYPTDGLENEDGRFDLRGAESIPLKIQQYPTPEDAERAYEAIMESKWVEDEEQWAPEPWHQVYYRRSARTIYAYSIRAERYVFSVAPSRTPWEERDDWNRLLEGTWIHPLTE